jgi:hypothetical protein
MHIAPVHAESVGTHQLQREWSNVGRDIDWIEQRASTQFFHTAGAWAGQAQRSSGKESEVTALIPFDQDAVVPSGDGVRDGGLQ